MSEIALDFEWARAPRYEIGSFRDLARFNSFKPKGKGEPRRPSKNWDEMGKRTQPDMAKFGVIVPEGKPRLFKPQSKILDEVIKRLLELGREFDLGAIPPSHSFTSHLQTVVPKLAQAIGLLKEPILGGEAIGTWVSLAKQLSGLFASPSPDELSSEERLGNYQLFLIRDNLGLRMATRPSQMYDAVMIYAAQSILGGAAQQVCETCGALFLTGGARTRGKKRAGARFCSNKCRADFHNAKVRKT